MTVRQALFVEGAVQGLTEGRLDALEGHDQVGVQPEEGPRPRPLRGARPGDERGGDYGRFFFGKTAQRGDLDDPLSYCCHLLTTAEGSMVSVTRRPGTGRQGNDVRRTAPRLRTALVLCAVVALAIAAGGGQAG